MEVHPEIKEEEVKAELEFLKNGAESKLYKSPMPASEAAQKIKEFTKAWAEPFAPSYNFSNPWATKKENKGKKERPAGKFRPGYQNGDVQA